MNFLLQNQTRWVFVFLLLSLLSFPLLSEQTILLKKWNFNQSERDQSE
ncbi:hypothetical protein LEP1GSC100_1315 [Leptospira interrogans serovar Bataviae str. UI 08561]|nr:hypothetical protein LEP1GSC100_1315 [Leptospira interrogans serovar Bataviae str. UI 08561]